MFNWLYNLLFYAYDDPVLVAARAKPRVRRVRRFRFNSGYPGAVGHGHGSHVINPATGLTMIGCVDIGGNAYGTSFDHSSGLDNF